MREGLIVIILLLNKSDLIYQKDISYSNAESHLFISNLSMLTFFCEKEV